MRLLIILSNSASIISREVMRKSLRSSGCSYEVIETNACVASTVKARLDEGWDCVVAAGGDGTVAAVADALLGTDIPLGILPFGTGNLVAREFGIPLDVVSAVDLVTRSPVATPRAIDAMRINGRIYLLNAGIGVNADVIDDTSRIGKSLFGRSAYVGAAIWKILQAKTHRLEITIDDDTQIHEATDVLISNCGILARALNPNGPDIRADDGHLDVCVMRMKSPLEYPWYYFMRRVVPKLVNRISVERIARRTITIRCPEPIAVQADGDVIGVTPMDIELLPLAVKLLARSS